MLKKVTLSFLASAMLFIPSFSGNSFANPLHEGKLENGRVLIPLRLVSEQLGANVDWNQQDKVVTITKENTTVQLTLNSPNMTVNQTQVTLDVPAKLYNGSRTYVPLRFVGQALGAEIGWDSQAKQATVTSGAQQVIIGMEQGVVQVPSAQRVTDQRAKVLVDKVNEATDLSSIKQIRTHFSPYFTDSMINSVIQGKGLKYNYKITTIYQSAINYTSQTKANLRQSYALQNNQTLYRDLSLVSSSGVWKVDAISFTVVDEIPRP